MARWTWNTSVVPVGTEVSRGTLADTANQKGSLVTDHSWSTLGWDDSEVFWLLSRHIFVDLASSAIYSNRTVVSQIIIEAIVIREVTHSTCGAVVAGSAFFSRRSKLLNVATGAFSTLRRFKHCKRTAVSSSETWHALVGSLFWLPIA